MVFLIFILISIDYLCPNSGDPDQMPRYAASDLGLQCVPMSHKKDARLIWVISLRRDLSLRILFLAM